jgi:hypothetical protein
MGLIVGAGNQLAEQVEVDAAAGLGGLRNLSDREAVQDFPQGRDVELSEKSPPL